MEEVWKELRLKTLDLLEKDSALKTEDNQWNLARARVAQDIFTHPQVKNLWLYLILEDQIQNYGIKNISKLMVLFQRNCTDPEYRAGIDSLMREEKEAFAGAVVRKYKQAGNLELELYIFNPEKHSPGDRRPVMLFFHGGSWYQGKPSWTFGACQRYARLGFVTIAVEYRVYDRQGTSPLECISDAKSAIRWVRKHSAELGADPEKIIACGYSAGGHLAACAAMLDILDEPEEDLSVRSRPDALVFFYSCFDPTLDRWFVKQVQDRVVPEEVSPTHKVSTGLPPALVLHGTEDRNCPFWTAEEFCRSMGRAGNICRLHSLEGAGHIFTMEKEYREEAYRVVEEFLAEHGLAPAEEEKK
jgi:acetyl esterase/lipase